MAKSRSLNKVMLIGNLTRNPVLRETPGGVLVCTFGIATNTSWKDANGNVQEKAEFHNIVAFNKLAEICAQVLASGMLVYLEGELRTRVKEEGEKKIYKTEIKLNDMVLLNSKDKKGVGVDAAKENMSSTGSTDAVVKEESVDADYEPEAVVDASADEEFNSQDLF